MQPVPVLLLQVEASVSHVGCLPNWLRGFDSRRPLQALTSHDGDAFRSWKGHAAARWLSV